MSFSIYTLYFVPKDEDYEKVKIHKAGNYWFFNRYVSPDFNVGPFWFIWLASYYLDVGE